MIGSQVVQLRLLFAGKRSPVFPNPLPQVDNHMPVQVTADPAHINERIQFRKLKHIQNIAGKNLNGTMKIFTDIIAFMHCPSITTERLTILDPTAGIGSIPFEALRLGRK